MAVRVVVDPPDLFVSPGCFLNRANAALRRRVRTGAEVAVVAGSAVRIGDVHGSASGPAADQVAKAVAAWVLAAPGPADSAVLMGGGEFAILCRGVRESWETDGVVRRIRDAMARRFEAGGELAAVATTAGVAMASSSGDTAEDLITAARRAMLAATRRNPAAPAVPAQARRAPGARRMPGVVPGRDDRGSQVVAAGHASATSAATAGMELAEAVVHRLFGVGVVLESAARLADGVVAARIREAVEELDTVIRDARGAAFGVRSSPRTSGTTAESRGGRVRAAVPG
jgi:GGDEF domain-containing protein